MAAANGPSYASASLYVGDLHPDVNETQLFDIFKAIGPVASIRVCRDAVTRRSLGYAYVNYHQFADAERALDILNHTEIKGKSVRVMWSQRDPQLRRSNVGNVYVKNLAKEVDNKALQDTFATFGNILSCKISYDDSGNSRGYGFVHYDSQDAADRAVAKLNGSTLNGKVLFVCPFQARKDRQHSEDAPKWTNVYVKHLDKSVDESKLREVFGAHGTITSAVLQRDDKGENKGFGFINYATHEEAQRAVEAANGKEVAGLCVPGQPLYVGRAQKKAERERDLKDMFLKIQRERMSKYQGVNLYVKNLDEQIDDARLRQEFGACGTITSATVMKDEKGVSKGFGFVCFSTPEEATKAVTDMNGKMILTKPIYVALAQRKEQRRAQLEAQHAMRAQQGVAGGPQAMRMPMVYPPGIFFQRTAPFPYPGPPQPMVQGGRGVRRGGPMYPGGPSQFPPQGGVRRGAAGRGRGGEGRGAYPGIKINPNVRNPSVPVPAQQVAQAELGAAGGAAATMSAEERRQAIGESLFPLVGVVLRALSQEGLAGKITGMLLESMEAEDLMQLIQSPEQLNKKIAEALQVLEAHNSAATTTA